MSFPSENNQGNRTQVANPQTPTLETERLILRPLQLDDAQPAFERWTSDEEVARYMVWSRHQSIEDTYQWLTIEVDGHTSRDNFGFAYVEKEGKELIGSGGILYDEDRDRYSLGYCLMKNAWGRGYATEAAQRILDFAVDELGITAFYAQHAQENRASGNVIQKLGFTFNKEGFFESFDKTKGFPSKEYLLDV